MPNILIHMLTLKSFLSEPRTKGSVTANTLDQMKPRNADEGT
jgi:hypothetical protein